MGRFTRLLAWLPVHLATTQTGRHAGMVVAGNVVNRALTFLIHSVLARSMGKAVFARFNVTAMALEVATELADLGLNVNLVRNYSRLAEQNQPAAQSVVQLVLRIKVVWVLFLTAVFYWLAPRFALLLQKPELTSPFRLVAIGLVAPVMVYFALAHLQAVQGFGRYILVNVVERIGLLAVVSAMALMGYLGFYSALGAWIVFPFLAAVLGLALAPHGYLRIRRIEPGVARAVFHFGKWALVSSLLTLALWRLDVFMMTALSTEEKLADYVYAVRLTALFQVVTTGLNTALLPRVGRFETIAQCRDYLRTIWKLSVVVAVGTVLVCLVARWLVLIPFGPKAVEAVHVFRILSISEAMMVIAVPACLLLYRLNRVDLICLMNAIMLVTCAVANWFLIPPYAATGAAVSYFLVRVTATVGIVIMVGYALRKQTRLGKLED